MTDLTDADLALYASGEAAIAIDKIQRMARELQRRRAGSISRASVDVARLRELLAKATPGPWLAENNDHGRSFIVTAYNDAAGPRHLAIVFINDESFHEPDRRHANADLMAAAINALPALCDLADRAERMAWQPIETYVPQNTGRDGLCDDPILGWWPGADWHVVYWRDGHFRNSNDNGPAEWMAPTHWMPLPAPPARAALEEKPNADQ